MSTSTKPQPSYAPSFDRGDIEIISSDGMRFRTNSRILSRASGFFASMFKDAHADTNEPDEAAVIAVDEDGKTLAILLRVSSGLPFLPDGIALELKALERLALAAEKYELGAALDVVRLTLQSGRFSQQESSLHRYALATRLGWDDLAKAAALESLDVALDYDALPYMDMRHLARLLSLRQRRIDMFIQIITSLNGLFALENNGNCRHSSKSHPAGEGKAAWPRLRASLIVEMWARPSGSSLFLDGEAIDALREAKCRVHDRNIFDIDNLKDKVARLISRLPESLV